VKKQRFTDDRGMKQLELNLEPKKQAGVVKLRWKATWLNQCKSVEQTMAET